MATQRFSDDVLLALQQSKNLRIRAGRGAHRFIGIWMVVVDGRVFVRSWSLKPGGWFRTFLKQPRGAMQIARREILVRAVRTRNPRMKSAVDRAYLAKYGTGWEAKYARDLVSEKSRAATMELVPLAAGR